MKKIIDVSEVYSADDIKKYIEITEVFNYNNIDLNKVKKSDLICIIGDLLNKINELNKKEISVTPYQAEIDQLTFDNNRLRLDNQQLIEKLNGNVKKLDNINPNIKIETIQETIQNNPNNIAVRTQRRSVNGYSDWN